MSGRPPRRRSRDRPHDLVLWGATGFTGRLVAEHLAARYGRSDVRWALAGRSEEKLAELRDRLTAGGVRPAALPVLTGDAHDRSSLEAIAERTRVVASTVGPYSAYGSTLVDVCVERRTDYCDLAGEIHWIQGMIDRHHERARTAGVRIVHACGFDSVPSDLGVLLLQRTAVARHGAPCDVVEGYVRASGAGMSGGTAASLMRTLETASEDAAAREALRNPRSLAPEGERERAGERPRRLPRRHGTTGEWTAPFLMAPVNERVVRRTNAVLGYPWGRRFRYREAMPTGPGWRGAVRALGTSAALLLLPAAAAFGPFRRLLQRHVLPRPGEGPDRAAIERGSFELRLEGRGAAGDTGAPFTVEATVAADREPGYGTTAPMLAEAAVCLARGEVESPLEGGVLTPASGIGPPFVARLRAAGMTVRAEEG